MENTNLFYNSNCKIKKLIKIMFQLLELCFANIIINVYLCKKKNIN